MSDPLRIGFVVEGPTDRVLLEAIVSRLLDGREYVPEQLSPELSETFAPLSGGGWTSVYRWCRQAASQAGDALHGNPLLRRFDMLIVHADADVAGRSYRDDQRIADAPRDLPCERPCPPASDTTHELREVMQGWMGALSSQSNLVLCTPSKSIETWILVALYPENPIARDPHVECRPNPDAQLQNAPLAGRMIRGGKKDRRMYRQRAREVAAAWDVVTQRCPEAARFSVEVRITLAG